MVCSRIIGGMSVVEDDDIPCDEADLWPGDETSYGKSIVSRGFAMKLALLILDEADDDIPLFIAAELLLPPTPGCED